MGIHDKQIKQRIKTDAEQFQSSFVNLSGVVMGDVPLHDLAAREKAKSAIEELLKFYHIKPRVLPDNITDINDQMDYLLNPEGIMRRTVKLTDVWYRKAIGAMLATLKETGDVVALIPRKSTGYSYYDYRQGRRVVVTKEVAARIDEDAVCFYKPLPQKEITAKDFIIYSLQALNIGDIVMLAAFTLTLTLVGMLVPFVVNQLFKSAQYSAGSIPVWPAVTMLIGVSVSSAFIRTSSGLVSARINTRIASSVSAAMMARVLALPARFFKDHSAGEISQRLGMAERVCSVLFSASLVITMTSLFSLVYVGQIFLYASVLVIPAMVVIAVSLTVSVLTSFAQFSHSKKTMEASAKESGLVFSLIRGVPKLKLSGSERRAFAKWSDVYVKSATLQYAPPLLVKYSSALAMSISLIGIIVMYYYAAAGGVSMPDYMAFNVAYGMVSGAFLALTGTALTIGNVAMQMKFMKPLLEVMPESSEGKKVVTRLSGGIEINNVSFRYSETMPMILDDISLKIRPGQYVAIVGPTGCGKSTLMRILLGLELPNKGAVYYDGQDISSLDLKSLRRNIGTVMQDGKLFQGDVFSNIVISAPQLTLDEAWEAAELAGIADDIRTMPMGMHTVIAEGGGGISGGQKQRLMIARAVAPKPKVLMLDEATSALDNITQRQVSDALAALKCTRIVIAHRLSTIKQATRILVLDGGKIVEDGDYNQLMEQNGIFADLVRRQITST